MNSKYNNIIVKKKWGFEYLCYQNEEVALWLLNINKNQGTSLHCHSNKQTGLLVLNGKVRVDFLADSKEMNELDKVMIRRGLFHKSTALEDDTILLEIETPNDKEDLLRLCDDYGRENEPYEGKASESPKDNSCLWIPEPLPGISAFVTFANKELQVENIAELSQLRKKEDNDLIVLLSGGFYKRIKNNKIVATKPGDIGYYKIMKQVTSRMDGCLENTIILTIKK